MKNIKNKLFILTLFIMPMTTIAKQAGDFGWIVGGIIGRLFYPLMMFIFSVGTVGFLWGVISLIIGGGGKDGSSDRAAAKQKVLWGAIVMALMFSTWGILNIIDNTLDLDKRPINTYPQFNLGN